MKLLGFPDLREKKGIKTSRSQLWRDVKAGRFPKPIGLTPNAARNYWLESELDDWIESRVRARDAATNSAA